jgi:hypothetical protein
MKNVNHRSFPGMGRSKNVNNDDVMCLPRELYYRGWLSTVDLPIRLACSVKILNKFSMCKGSDLKGG